MRYSSGKGWGNNTVWDLEWVAFGCKWEMVASLLWWFWANRLKSLSMLLPRIAPPLNSI